MQQYQEELNDINNLRMRPFKEVGVLASEVVPVKPRWLWENRLTMGKFHMLVGEPGIGKTMLTAMMAAHITNGREWPDGTPCPIGGVVIVAPEDSAEDTIVPRLIDAGADRTKVRIVSTAIEEDSNSMRGRGETRFQFPRHVGTLRDAIRSVHAKLVIIDTIEMSIEDISINSPKILAQFVNPVLKICSDMGVCVLGVNHFKPGKYNENNAETRINGHASLNRASRITTMAIRDMANPGIIMWKDIKRNIGKEPPVFFYRITETTDGRVFAQMVAGNNINDDEKIEAYKLADMKQQILLYMKHRGVAVEPLEVAQDLELNDSTVRQYMRRLLQDGHIQQVGYGLYIPAQFKKTSEPCKHDAEELQELQQLQDSQKE